jgi:hypothetical protein
MSSQLPTFCLRLPKCALCQQSKTDKTGRLTPQMSTIAVAHFLYMSATASNHRRQEGDSLTPPTHRLYPAGLRARNTVAVEPVIARVASEPTNQPWNSCGGLSGQNQRISAVNRIRPKTEVSAPGLSRPWGLRARRWRRRPRVDRWYRPRLSFRHFAASPPRGALVPCARR